MQNNHPFRSLTYDLITYIAMLWSWKLGQGHPNLYNQVFIMPKCYIHAKLYSLDKISCFVLSDSLHPINNLSDIKGRVLLDWTSTKLELMWLLKDTT